MRVFDVNKGKIGDPDGNVVLVRAVRGEYDRRKATGKVGVNNYCFDDGKRLFTKTVLSIDFYSSPLSVYTI